MKYVQASEIQVSKKMPWQRVSKEQTMHSRPMRARDPQNTRRYFEVTRTSERPPQQVTGRDLEPEQHQARKADFLLRQNGQTAQ